MSAKLGHVSCIMRACGRSSGASASQQCVHADSAPPPGARDTHTRKDVAVALRCASSCGSSAVPRQPLALRQLCGGSIFTSAGSSSSSTLISSSRAGAALASAGATSTRPPSAAAGAHRLRARARPGGASSCAPLSRPTKFSKFRRRALLLYHVFDNLVYEARRLGACRDA
eukprot:7138983-Prymnesium_polylepis.1